jgi:uncharacterized protein YciI
MPTFAYFYFMSDAAAKSGTAVPAHIAYWKQPGAQKHSGGPFADHTGGLITFDAPHYQLATRIVEEDPFVRDGLLSRHWLKEWMPE